MLRSILFALLLSVAAATEAKTILVVGDSLSAGYGLRRDEAWPSLLARRLQAERPPWQVVNASISGDTSANGRSRIDTALRQHRPAIVIIALGANDGLRGLPVGSLRENLEAMVDSAQRAGAKVIIAGLRMPPNYGPDYTQKFQGTFAEVARAKRAALVPFLLDGFAERSDYFQDDSLHPTAAAQPMIMENVWAVLRPMLG